MAVWLKPLHSGSEMSRKSLRALRSVSSAIALSQPVMASYQECTARLAASGSMVLVCTSGSSQVANRTAHIVSHLGDGTNITAFNCTDLSMALPIALQCKNWVTVESLCTFNSTLTDIAWQNEHVVAKCEE